MGEKCESRLNASYDCIPSENDNNNDYSRVF